jgi:hypothetical protein
MRGRSIPISISIAALAAQAVGLASPVLAADPTVVPFTSTGAEQSWVVPIGVSTIHVVLVGGKGGTSAVAGTGSGGFGDRVEVDLAVIAGTTLYVEVGGNGADGTSMCSVAAAGGFNGGGSSGTGTISPCAGGGGGASDLRTLPSVNGSTLASRLLVAGAGGGAGGASGFSGGDAGTAAPGGASGGGAGTGAAGGAGGSGTSSASNGTLGQGGVGISSGNSAPVGGGGGGGLYGGGGGNGAGGGGGSSYTGAGTGASVATDTSGVPSITISYGGTPASGGTVDATVTMAVSAVCLELSSTAIDFGTRQFGDVGIAGTPGVTVTNCGGIDEDVLAHGTDASGIGPTSWTLDDTGTCLGGTLAADHFGLSIERQDTAALLRLSTVNKSLESLAGGAAIDHVARIDTPCPGSNGAGVVMTMQITFVATEPAP